MAATIAPGRLLSTLRVLLSPTGGIKSSNEVERLVPLMQKFSRKLVSKVIYIKILKSSSPELLELFLKTNGWSLLTTWLITAVTYYNWPLCSQLLQLLLLAQPPPTEHSSVLDILHCLVSSNQSDILLSRLASKVLASWASAPVTTSTNASSKFKSQFSSLSSQTQFSSSLPTETASPMSLSRRAKRSVIVTNPDAAFKDTSEKTIMTVTFQEFPLENMVDLTKQKQKRVDIDTAPNNQKWERLRGSSRTRSKILADQDKSDLEESDISKFPADKSIPTRTKPVESSTAPLFPVKDFYGSSSPRLRIGAARDDFDQAKLEDVAASLGHQRHSQVFSGGINVKVVLNEDIPLMTDLHDKPEVADEDESPLKMFEDISEELKENLKMEKMFTLSKERNRNINVRGCEENLWSWNNNEKFVQMEGTAKDFRLARREKFREEKKRHLELEVTKEIQDRKDREEERVRVKTVKREKENQFRRRKLVEEKELRENNEKEERRKRKERELEFIQKREEQRLKRIEKERRAKDFVSFKKSELKNELNHEEKSRIKLLAQQLKEKSTQASPNDLTKSSAFQETFSELTQTDNSSEATAENPKPSKLLFSVAINKNADLLASLEDPRTPLKRTLAKPGPSRLLPKSRPQVLDYGVKMSLDSPFQIPKIAKIHDGKAVNVVVNNDGTNCVEKSTGIPTSRIKSASIISEMNALEDEDLRRQLPDNKSFKNKITAPKKVIVQTSTNNLPEKKSQGSNASKLEKGDVKKIKPTKSLTLKPVSQLKESNVFGSFLEHAVKSGNKKRKSNSHDKNKKLKHSKLEDVKKKLTAIPSESSGEDIDLVKFKNKVPIVPRKVSGILIVSRGSGIVKKSLKWRDESDLVRVEYFDVDTSERVNVNKLKFEDIFQQEHAKERNLLNTRHLLAGQDSEADERAWPGLQQLDCWGRRDFKSGQRSGERQVQQMREGSVLPYVSFGSSPLDPSEPEMVNHTKSLLVRDILAEDISGEGTHVDYSQEKWSGLEVVIKPFDQEVKTGKVGLIGSDDLAHDQEYDQGHKSGLKVEQRIPNHPPIGGFGRGASFVGRGTRTGFRGGRIYTPRPGFGWRGRGGGSRRVPCMYWERGSCRDGEICKFLHL